MGIFNRLKNLISNRKNPQWIELVANNSMFAVLLMAIISSKKIAKEIEGKKIKFTDDDLVKMKNILISVFHFEAKALYWKILIEDDGQVKILHKILDGEFRKVLGFDPKVLQSDYVNYVNDQGDRGKVMYVGSKVCRDVFKGEDAYLMLIINTIYTSYLGIFQDSIVEISKSDSLTFNNYEEDLRKMEKKAEI